MKPDAPHAVYRFYDADDVLLYVGLTCQASRLVAHRSSHWFQRAARITVEHVANRNEARQREAQIIDAEGPRFNARPGCPNVVVGDTRAFDDEPALTLSLEEAAAVLGVSSTSIYRYVLEGRVPGAFKMLGRWRVSRPALETFLANPSAIKESA